MTDRHDQGFGLAEAVVASGLLVALSAGLAHLTALSSRAIARAASESIGLMLAVQKMEQLRSLTWVDRTTDLATDPPTPQGRGLRISPAHTLARNTPGYVDYLDRQGRRVGTGMEAPLGTVHVRRWAVRIAGLPQDDMRALQVVVIPLRLADQTIGSLLGPNEPEVAWLTTLVSRR